ncbi:MAG: polyprenyl synthetase family protein [Syntrophaceae bacterium]
MNAEFEQGLRDMTTSSSVLTREIGSYILDGGGKRLRPKLVLLMSEAVGLDKAQALPLAYAVELLHNASLLHDDVVDGTEIRRSRPTANQVFGDKPALLAGDYLSASALDIVFSLDNVHLASQIVKTIKKMAEGELLEIEHAAVFHDKLDAYLQIIYLKTASLFELCTMAPGIVVGLEANELDAMAEFGRSIGMAFQIVDDIINLAPLDQDDKDAYNDIAERKSTLPLINLFHADPALLELLKQRTSPEDWRKEIIPRLSPDLLKQSRALAETFLAQALKAVDGKGFFTSQLERIPALVLAPLEHRF